MLIFFMELLINANQSQMAKHIHGTDYLHLLMPTTLNKMHSFSVTIQINYFNDL